MHPTATCTSNTQNAAQNRTNARTKTAQAHSGRCSEVCAEKMQPLAKAVSRKRQTTDSQKEGNGSR